MFMFQNLRHFARTLMYFFLLLFFLFFFVFFDVFLIVLLCFVFMQATNPWFQVDLTKAYYIHTVHVFLGTDCCPKAGLNITVKSTKNPSPSSHSCNEPNHFPRNDFRVFRCSPPVIGRHVTVRVTGEDVTLVLCEVAVYAFGKLHVF